VRVTVIYDPAMRRFITAMVTSLMLIVAGLLMATPAHAVTSCPSGYGYFCFWNQSFGLGNRYVANYTQKGFRLGPYWADRVFSWKNPGSTVDWVLYRDYHCQDPFYIAYHGTQNSNNIYGGLYHVRSVSTIGSKGKYCP
jgi:peptidase inhibitor family I36